ncbi:MAG: CHAT domain-containing protein [Cyanobacteria bacterium P01_A01_bin.40]
MIKYIRSLSLLLFLGLFSFTLALAVPAIAQPPTNINQRHERSTNLDLIDRGQANYQAGRYTAAVNAWQQAEQMYQRQGDRLNRASSLNYLSMAHQELGQWQQAQQKITQSLKLLQQTTLQEQNLALLAQALNTQGSLQLATGKPEAAIETWQQAASKYQDAQDEMGVIGSKINQAQAMQTMGLHRRSQKLLTEVRQQLNQQSDPVIKAKVLHSLGTTLQTIGDLSQSQEVLTESLAIAQEFNLSTEQASIFFSLGNVYRLRGENETAIAWYRKAVAENIQPLSKVEAQLNLLNSLIVNDQESDIKALLPQINANLANLSNSRPALYAQINLAKNLIDLDQAKYSQEIESLLQKTIKQAVLLKDNRAESSAWGTLGHYDEQQQQWKQAQTATEKALSLAETIDAEDIGYQWQWQLGRILNAENQKQKAIASYVAAVDNLQYLRSSLVAINTDAQFSFRESVEPVYRELVGLLLDIDPSQEQLQQARDVIESLQLAELENFFQEACLDADPKQIDRVDPTAAVIYPIILRDRIAVILSLPDKSLKYYATYLPEAKIGNTIDNLHQSFYPFFSNQQRLKLSQEVYDWLIKPAEADLTKNNIKTLAFVLDGNLRNIPVAALYDGNRYTIEKYNIALTPGLQLLPSSDLRTEKLTAVIAGLSESNQGFSALPGVKEEVSQISSQLSSQLLLNDSFTDDNLQNQLQKTNAPIVHLATHGQFGSTPEETFIATWNDRIQVNELENLLRDRDSSLVRPIELMVLSACQTATGDNRAALGMAGMAIRSGARSTLATLWSVKDESTSRLINKFYQQLVSSGSVTNKAEALRQAQLSLIKSQDFNHPFYWAPFVLVGNWL